MPWLNKAVKTMWPFLDKAIASSVIFALSDVVNDLAKMSKLKIGFRTWTLGDEPPILTAAKVLDDVESEVTLDLEFKWVAVKPCLLYTSPSPRDRQKSRMPSSA